MCTKTKSTAPERLVLSAAETAELLGISQRHLWKLHATQQLPRPVRFGRCVRWRTGELERWLGAGCPDRETWEHDRAERA